MTATPDHQPGFAPNDAPIPYMARTRKLRASAARETAIIDLR